MLMLINLDAAVERRVAMARQLDRLALPFERVGVDLRHADDARVEARARELFPALRFERRRLSNAEIGCWLSHLLAWQALLRQTQAPSCTVIEDDLRLLPGFADAVAALALREEFDLVYLGTSSRNVSQRRRSEVNGLAVHAPLGVIYNTWAYNIRRDYAQRFFDEGPRRIAQPIDHFLGGRAETARPAIGVLQPLVVAEDPVLGSASQIGPHTRRLDRSSWLQDARRRILASPISQAYYSLYRYL